MDPQEKDRIALVVGGLAGAYLGYTYWAPYLGYSSQLSKGLIALPLVVPAAAGLFSVTDDQAPAIDKMMRVGSAVILGSLLLSQGLGTALLKGAVKNEDLRALLASSVGGVVVRVIVFETL